MHFIVQQDGQTEGRTEGQTYIWTKIIFHSCGFMVKTHEHIHLHVYISTTFISRFRQNDIYYYLCMRLLWPRL